MAAFDEAWWDARTRRHGRFDTRGVPAEGAVHVTWIRWRLIDELLRRYYVDFGLEPGFAMMGTELYNVALMSPTCRRAPRYFGRLCGTDVHPEDDTDLISPLGALTLVWAGSQRPLLEEGLWSSWAAYLRAAIETLGLAMSGVGGHEGCFHRRGKALTPLTFRIALLLRTAGGHTLEVGDDAMLTVGPWLDQQRGNDLRDIIGVIERCGGTLPAGPARYIAVRTFTGWIALRTDGWVATGFGALDVGGLWRRGANEEEIALAIEQVVTT